MLNRPLPDAQDRARRRDLGTYEVRPALRQYPETGLPRLLGAFITAAAGFVLAVVVIAQVGLATGLLPRGWHPSW